MVPPPKHPPSREDDDERPLTGDDFADLRKLIAVTPILVEMAKARQSRTWVRQWLKRYAWGTAGLVGLLAAFREDITALAAWLFGGNQ